jgi:hypothetical protein
MGERATEEPHEAAPMTDESRYLAPRRASAALLGTGVGLTIFALTHAWYMKAYFQTTPFLAAMMPWLVGVPLASVVAFTYGFTRRFPRVPSVLLVAVSLWIALTTGTWTLLIYSEIVEGSTMHPFTIIMVGLLDSLFGILLVNPVAVLIGAVTFYLLDRAALTATVPATEETP